MLEQYFEIVAWRIIINFHGPVICATQGIFYANVCMVFVPCCFHVVHVELDACYPLLFSFPLKIIGYQVMPMMINGRMCGNILQNVLFHYHEFLVQEIV